MARAREMEAGRQQQPGRDDDEMGKKGKREGKKWPRRSEQSTECC